MLIRTLKIVLVGLALSGAVAAATPRAETATVQIAVAPRPAHRLPRVEGCFVPPPEPVAVAPCDDDVPSPARSNRRGAR